jgi:hypothetical protein
MKSLLSCFSACLRRKDMHRFLTAALLSAALAVPVAIRAEEHHSKRYYDQDGRDWHEWNEQEERAYRRHLEERRREYRNWEKANPKEQKEYWKWRHRHPDSVLFRQEIR